jgi:hypothetical protein
MNLIPITRRSKKLCSQKNKSQKQVAYLNLSTTLQYVVCTRFFKYKELDYINPMKVKLRSSAQQGHT